VQTREKLAGIGLEDGAVLWEEKVPAFRGMNILTPTVFENQVFTSSYGGKSTLYRIDHGSDGWQVSTAWVNKTQGYMSSPVVIDGHAYLHLRNQRFTCIDLTTGEERWITEPFGSYWSLVAQGDRILALDERGQLLMIRANPERFELLDSRKVSTDPTWAHLALAGPYLVIRELNALAVYRWTP
jgi:outer membrane protein assembly factor BamB